MKFHVLPGDSLVETFSECKIEGEIIVCRECLIEGDVGGKTLAEFWQIRSEFIDENYGDAAEIYYQKVVGEFEKLQNITDKDEVYLWFEYELFCQVNMWFCLSLLKHSKAKVYRVAPVVRNEKNIWKGFGDLFEEDLRRCFAKRTKFTESDLKLGADLWEAYRNKDYTKLIILSVKESACFPQLVAVCEAEIEKKKRPVKALNSIISSGETNFGNIFKRFSEREGVYGFGDAQVKRIYDTIKN